MSSRLQRAKLTYAAVGLALASLSGASVADAPPPRAGKSYYLPMADGTKIAVSLYFPEGKVPVQPTATLLVQTRYGRAGALEYAAGLEKSYAIAIADTRGSTASFGERRVDIGPEEEADMDQLIAHLARQPWSNGKVYSYGISYMADTADVASSRPAPELAGAIIREVDFDTMLHLFAPGGVPNDWFLQGYGSVTKAMDEGRSPSSSEVDCVARAEDCAKLWPILDPVDGDQDYSQLRQALTNRVRWQPDDYLDAGYHDGKGRNGYSQFESSPAYRMAGIRKQAKPALVWGSWVDGGTAEAALARYRSAPDVPMELWIGANDHEWRLFADPFFPTDKRPQPAPDEQVRIQTDFLSRLGAGQPIARRIHYYVLGARQFKVTESWPPRGVSDRVMYLDAGHRLAAKAPASGKDLYEANFAATTGDNTRWSTQFGTAPAYADRRDEDAKLLVYDSEPMTRDQELAGHPVIDLRVTTDSSDPAFHVYLEDVAPDGRVTYLTEGMFRAIHRAPGKPSQLPYDMGPAPHSYRQADALPVVPGKEMQVRFALFPVAARIARGHRLRVAIAATDACCFRTLSNGGKDRFVVSRGARASSITLPLRPWSDR